MKIPLEGFPERPNKTTKIRVAVGFLDEKTMVVKLTDQGFGELFPKTDAVVPSGGDIMSLILCRQEPVTVPLYIEDLGIHLYSSQELCYVIYNNPLLVLEGFIDKRLTEFLRSELRMPFLAERVEKWLDSTGRRRRFCT